MPEVERPKALHGRKANRAFIWQECGAGQEVVVLFQWLWGWGIRRNGRSKQGKDVVLSEGLSFFFNGCGDGGIRRNGRSKQGMDARNERPKALHGRKANRAFIKRQGCLSVCAQSFKHGC